jgi:hypothetical protein
MADPATAPDYPDRGAQRVSLARRGKVVARSLAATTDLDLDFGEDDELKGMLGRWIVIEVIGGELGYFWATRAQADEAPAVNPVLAAVSGATQCGRIPADRETPGFASVHYPVLRVVSGAAAVTIRIYDAET